MEEEMNWFRNWLVNHYAGKAVAVLAQFIGSVLLANAGVLKTYGVTTTVDPAVLAGSLLALVHLVWAKWRGSLLKVEDKAIVAPPK